jgi:transcriptional antiterminator RfaH
LERTGIAPLQWIPHTIGLVSFDGIPAEVPDTLIAALKQHVHEVSSAGSELLYKLKAGDLVEIKDGPFAGYEAIFDTRLSGRDRVRVLLQLLNDRVVPLELDATALKQKTTVTNGNGYPYRR